MSGGGGAAGPGERALPGGLRMEDGFSSYGSLYDTSSLLQFCNGERRRAGARGPRRGPRRGARPGGRGGRAKLRRTGARFPPPGRIVLGRGPRAALAAPPPGSGRCARGRPARAPPARAHPRGSAWGGPAAPGSADVLRSAPKLTSARKGLDGELGKQTSY